MADRIVRTKTELIKVMEAAQPGDRIRIDAEVLEGGIHLTGVAGAPNKPIRLGSLRPERPAVIRGGRTGLQLSQCPYWHLSDLRFEDQTDNCVNLDDGGDRAKPVLGVTLQKLSFRHAGTPGNRDSLKMSGLKEFLVEECRIVRWGGSGQGIDLVGCHQGRIRRCLLQGQDGVGIGLQIKGGSGKVQVDGCQFLRAGQRAINIGGHTGLEYFRPPLPSDGEYAEARQITVEHCAFIGADAPLAFVGVDGALAQQNTLYIPGRWAIRILQENTARGFVPSRHGVFRRNIIVFQSSRWASGGVNIGPNTAPQTFRFQENWWFCTDDPHQSQPRLPTPEQGGVYGRDPQLRDPKRDDLRHAPDSPAKGYGAEDSRFASSPPSE